MKKDKDISFNNIESSLRYGALRLPKEWLAILRVIIIACGIGEIAGLLVAIVYKEPAAIVTVFVFIAILLACVIVFVHFHRRKTKAKLWLKDAVPLKAKCSPLGKQPEEKEIGDGAKAAIILITTMAMGTPGIYQNNRFPNPRILLTFKYNGKVVKRMSGKQGYSEDEVETGRNPIFKKYIGKEIDILYSPKYDEVLLLKLNDKA